MILNLMAAEKAMRTARKHPLVKGSRGQLVENPAFQTSSRCDAQAVSFARQLRLTPFVRGNGKNEDQEGEADPFDALDAAAADELAQRRRKKTAT